MKNNETDSIIDMFPYITWDADLKVVNRKLKYFYDAGTKKRRLMRLVNVTSILFPPYRYEAGIATIVLKSLGHCGRTKARLISNGFSIKISKSVWISAATVGQR